MSIKTVKLHQEMCNLSSNYPAKFHAIRKILHVSATYIYVGEKTPISDHRGPSTHIFSLEAKLA